MKFQPPKLETAAIPTVASHAVKVSAKTLAEELEISQSTLWRWRKRPGFPQPKRLGPNTVRFDRAAVLDWLDAQEAA